MKPFRFNKTISVFIGISCHLRLEGEEGVLESPNYPANYPSNIDCIYDIARTSSSVCGVRLYSTLMENDFHVNDCLTGSFLPSFILVEDLNIPGSVTSGDVCMNDYIAVESCVPEGGARFCGNDSGISRKRTIKVQTSYCRLPNFYLHVFRSL